MLENISAYPDGQIYMMKPSNINDLLDLIMHGMTVDQVCKLKLPVSTKPCIRDSNTAGYDHPIKKVLRNTNI